MRIAPALSLFAAIGLATSTRAANVLFTYTQTDSATGSGTIPAFTYNDDPGGPINFTATPMPAANVFNPNPGLTPVGFVGAQTTAAGNSNEANVMTGLTWSGTVTATGTRGADVFTIDIVLKFVTKVVQTPTDTSDYNWSVAFGDSAAGDITAGNPRNMMLFSRDTVIDGIETMNTFQRYTQQNNVYTAGVNSFTNTDTTNTTIKDATDGGAPAGVDAAGRDLAFYFGWRDQGPPVPGTGPILIDTFTVGGLLATGTLVPEPSSALLALGAAGVLLRRRRQ